MTLSVVMVTYNSADVVEGAVRSVRGIADEVLVGDGGSTDGTMEIVRRHGATVIEQRASAPLGVRKQELVEKAKGEWILVLDADERVSSELAYEISRITAHHRIRLEHKNVMDPRLRGDDKKGSGDDKKEVGNDKSIVAYRIPYQNYVFGKPVYYGGERYAKVRLFRWGYGRVSPEPLHEEVEVNGKIGMLKGKIHHHSYRTPWQLFTKFTRYAWMEAGVKNKKEAGSRVKPGMTMERLFLYGPHMFWARFVKEKGYKDGWRGLILAAAFGYMEGLTYWFGLARKFRKVTPCNTARSDL